MFSENDDTEIIAVAEEQLARQVTTDKLALLRKCVADKQFCVIEEVVVDITTAHAILLVHDALNDANKAKLMALSITKVAAVCWKLIN